MRWVSSSRSTRGRPYVLRMVLGEGLQLLGFGLLVGLIGAFSATRIIRSLLYSTSATDALSFVFVAMSGTSCRSNKPESEHYHTTTLHDYASQARQILKCQ